MTQKRPELSAESTLTDRYQTTIPAMVRKALGLQKGDKLAFLLDDSGGVRVAKQQPDVPEHSDPAVGAFLQFLESDIATNPQNLVEMDKSLFELMRVLSSRVPANLDLDAPLEEDED